MQTRYPPASIGQDRHLVTFESRRRPPCPTPRAGSRAPGRRCRPPTWYVRIRPATAGDVERALAGTLITHRSSVVHGRYHPGVTLAARMIFEGKTYQVTSVLNRRRTRSGNGSGRGPAGIAMPATLTLRPASTSCWRRSSRLAPDLTSGADRGARGDDGRRRRGGAARVAAPVARPGRLRNSIQVRRVTPRRRAGRRRCRRDGAPMRISSNSARATCRPRPAFVADRAPRPRSDVVGRDRPRARRRASRSRGA